MLLNHNHNFIIVNKEGMSVVSLGDQQKQEFCDDQGNRRMLHNLESYNHFKLESDNHLVYNCTKPEKNEIMIQEEYRKGTDDAAETQF